MHNDGVWDDPVLAKINSSLAHRRESTFDHNDPTFIS